MDVRGSERGETKGKGGERFSSAIPLWHCQLLSGGIWLQPKTKEEEMFTSWCSVCSVSGESGMASCWCYVKRRKTATPDVSPKPTSQPVNNEKLHTEFSKWKQATPQRRFQALFLLGGRCKDDRVLRLRSRPGGSGRTGAASRFQSRPTFGEKIF